MLDMNRIGVILNPYQGEHKRVLCICSGGVLRSPTAAVVLSRDPWNHNTRAAGTEDYALVKVDEALMLWAQEIVCMTKDHERQLLERFPDVSTPRKVLEVPDNFAYRDTVLMGIIAERYKELSK